MSHFRVGFVLILMCAACSCSSDTRNRSASTPRPPEYPPRKNSPDSRQMTRVIEGTNVFALDLYQQIRSVDGNLFFSPASISVALAMASAGAAGPTRTEIVETLHFPKSDGDLQAGMKALLSSWSTYDPNAGIRLSLANRLWGQEGTAFLPPFLSVTRERYGAELVRLDFAREEDSRQTINVWVQERTEGKITDLIPPGVLTPLTRLVLTNAVYFHGAWTTPFERKGTRDDRFYPTATDTVMVPMMYASGTYRCASIDHLKVLELPYGDGSLSMFIFLPDWIDGLADLESRLTLGNLQRWMDRVKPDDHVVVRIPRFRTTSEFELSRVLSAMGMPMAFDCNIADFSGMTGARGLCIRAVLHKSLSTCTRRARKPPRQREPSCTRRRWSSTSSTPITPSSF